MADYHVTKRSDGKWAATGAGNARASSLHERQRDAQKAATGYAGSSGGGEVRIHGEDGRIRNSNTIGKRDPNPPKDRRH